MAQRSLKEGDNMANVTQEVWIEDLEKLPDGNFKRKNHIAKSKSGVTFDDHLAEDMMHWKLVDRVTTSTNAVQIDIPIPQNYNEIKVVMKNVFGTVNNFGVALGFNNVKSSSYRFMRITGTSVYSNNGNSIEMGASTDFGVNSNNNMCNIHLFNHPNTYPSAIIDLFTITSTPTHNLVSIRGVFRVMQKINTLNIKTTVPADSLISAGAVFEVWGR